MSWSEVLFRARREAIAFAIVYLAAVAAYILGVNVPLGWPNNDFGAFGFLGVVSLSGLIAFGLLKLPIVIAFAGTLVIAIKILSESVTDHVIRRMEFKGLK